MNSLRRALLPGRLARRPVLVAALLALIAIAAAALLLALAGWLITATALAGLGVLLTLDIFAPGAGIRTAAVVRTAARYFERLIGHDATFRQLASLRVAAFERLIDMPVLELLKLRRGDTLNRLTRDIDTLDHLLPRLLLPTLGALGATGLALAVVAWIAPRLAVGVVCLIVLGGLVLVAGTIAAVPPGRKLAAATPHMRGQLAEWLEGLAELVSLDRAGERAEQVLQASRAQIRAQRAQRRIEAVMQSGLMLAGYLGFWLVLLLGLQLYASGLLSAPTIAAAALAMLALVDAWTPLAAGWSFLETARRAAARVDGLATLAARRQGGGSGACSALPGHPGLEVLALKFRHAEHLPELFHGLDFRLEAGERLLVQGPSGCGKSTLGQLLAGVLEPTGGQIRLGGVALERIDRQTLRRSIGWLPQQVTLFHDTVEANLRLAAPLAPSARLAEVLEWLELGQWLAGLPDGLETWIGEYGNNVSGGQARRLALARMVLADFPVLVLDEPTAGLDLETARRIAARLEPWLRDRTVVMLSHDSATLPRFDRQIRWSGSGAGHSS